MYTQFYFICLYGSDAKGELAFTLCHFTTAINCSEMFIALTDSSELPHQDQCNVFRRPSAFLGLYFFTSSNDIIPDPSICFEGLRNTTNIVSFSGSWTEKLEMQPPEYHSRY
jgi:hypothetical protein